MTTKKKPCRHPGCPKLTTHKSGFCTKHYSPIVRRYDKERVTSTERGYDSVWHKLSNMKLRANPMCQCEECRGHGKIADTVHHIKSVEEYPELRLDWDNLLSMNHVCHDRLHAKRGERFKWTGNVDRGQVTSPGIQGRKPNGLIRFFTQPKNGKNVKPYNEVN